MISAYRIGKKVWIVHTENVADPRVPRTLPIGSTVLTLNEAAALAEQIADAATKKKRVPA